MLASYHMGNKDLEVKKLILEWMIMRRVYMRNMKVDNPLIACMPSATMKLWQWVTDLTIGHESNKYMYDYDDMFQHGFNSILSHCSALQSLRLSMPGNHHTDEDIISISKHCTGLQLLDLQIVINSQMLASYQLLCIAQDCNH